MAKTLYERLGGYDAIASVVDSLMVRLKGDARLAKYFARPPATTRRSDCVSFRWI